MKKNEWQTLLWSVYNQATQINLQHVTTQELQLIGNLLHKDQLEEILVCNSEMKNWCRLTSIPELLTYHEKIIDLDLPKPPSDPSKEKTVVLAHVVRTKEDELKAVDFRREMPEKVLELRVESDEELKSLRRYKRYKKIFKVELERNGKVFNTSTVNVSAGGMMIKDPLPEWLFGYFTARIFDVANDRSMTHLCWTVEDQNKVKRIHIAFLPFESNEVADKFDAWLKSA